jgi:putative ABC transport system substrate-binding protein
MKRETGHLHAGSRRRVGTDADMRRSTRRALLIALGTYPLTAPLSLFAQQPAAMRRIGFLGPTSAAGIATRLEGLRAGLREQGFVEGENLVIEFRWAEGNYERLPILAAELARLKVEVIVTHTTPGSRAAKQATSTIPIVTATVGDPVGSGLIATLARPGGNLTGLSIVSPEITAKRLELIRETLPRIRRVALFYNADNSGSKADANATAATASALKVEVQHFGVKARDEFENAFAAMVKRRIDAVVIPDDPLVVANAALIARLAAKHRLPSIGPTELTEAGGLMVYGVNFPAMFQRSAIFVSKILKGAKPGDLPVEQPTKFEMIVNMKTAKALGIKIPNSILVRAERVIE